MWIDVKSVMSVAIDVKSVMFIARDPKRIWSYKNREKDVDVCLKW